MSNRYIVFKPPVVEGKDYTRKWYCGVRFDKAKTTEAVITWEKLNCHLSSFWDGDEKRYCFLPGSEVAGEYQNENIAQQIARDLNEKESKRKQSVNADESQSPIVEEKEAM